MISLNTKDAPIRMEIGNKYQFQFRFGEPFMQDAMLRFVRQKPEIAARGVPTILSNTVNAAGMDTRQLGCAVALSLMFKQETFLRQMCSGTAFEDYADHTLSLSRIVSISAAEHQLEWLQKVLANPEDCSFSLLAGVPVKNIVIVSSTSCGEEVICVALRHGSDDQAFVGTGKHKVEIKQQLVVLHMSCGKYHGDIMQETPNQGVTRKSFASDRYKEMAGQFAEKLSVIPILFELPQSDLKSSSVQQQQEEEGYLKQISTDLRFGGGFRFDGFDSFFVDKQKSISVSLASHISFISCLMLKILTSLSFQLHFG